MIITINGSELSSEFEIKKCIYNDYSAGRADALDLLIYDKERKLLKNGINKGVTITAEVDTISTGITYISSIDYMNDHVNLHALSTKPSTISEKSFVRFDISNREVLEEVARELNLNLVNLIDKEYRYSSIERINESAMKYAGCLYLLEGTVCKIFDGKLIAYNEEAYENKDTIHDLSATDFLSFPFFSTSDAKIISKIQNNYIGKTQILTSLDSNCTGKDVLINQKTDSATASERMIRSILRDANKLEYNGSGIVNKIVPSGITVNLDPDDFGVFSGKNYIFQAKHDLLRERSQIFFRKPVLL